MTNNWNNGPSKTPSGTNTTTPSLRTMCRVESIRERLQREQPPASLEQSQQTNEESNRAALPQVSAEQSPVSSEARSIAALRQVSAILQEALAILEEEEEEWMLS